MARPPCPKPMPREKGFKCQQSTLSFPASSSSNPKTQYSSQPAPTSHTLSPLETLLSQPIPFVKTQTISGALAECQTVFSLGYFGKEMGRKRCLVSVEGKAIKKMRRDSSTKDVDDRDPSGDEVLGQSQPVREWRVVGEGSVGKTASETPARKIKLLHSRKTTVPLKDRKNEPNKELANTTPKKSTASGGTLVKPIPGSPKEVIKKNGLKKVSHLLEPGVQNGPYTGSAVLLPDGTTAPGMATLERESTSKGQFRNLKLNTGSVANNSGKTIVSGTSDLNRKSEALSERSSGKCPDKLRVKGLMNTSFFCYRNSVLQLLASSTVFVEEITRHINEKCECGPNCVSRALGKFFQNHFIPAGGQRTLNIYLPLVIRLRNVLPQPFGRNQCNQEDASEYLLALLNKGMDQLNGTQETNSEENHFDRVFGAKYDSILTCPICNNRSVTPEYQLSLQLTPKANSKAMIDLKACFATNFSREYVEASCDNCGHKTEASDKSKWFSKKTEIRKLPKFLIINISRYRIGGLAQTKIMNPVNLEENLVLKEGDKDVTYQLRGMISHKGEQVRCGHYIAFVKQPDRTWARCDDTTIKQTNLKQIKLQQNTFQIYMLGYEQVTC